VTQIVKNFSSYRNFSLYTYMPIVNIGLQGGPKTNTQFYFLDNFGNSAPILTILSLLQGEIYGA